MTTYFINNKWAVLSALLLSASMAIGHGLMVEPAARNAKCGLQEKPDNATTAACVDAFADDFNGGYQFMSVLSHDVGRKGVTPLPTNVCGFDSETWNGGATPWDKATHWPANPAQAGPLDIIWDISWGPHFDDTEEFRYWITKADFQFDPGQALTWNDFASEAFCVLTYNDTQPDANPNVIADKANTLFTTRCTLPARSGHHVVYGEWGRNYYTFERFHGCIDLQFSAGPLPPQAIAQSVSVDRDNNLAITLEASDVDGQITAYAITTQPAHGSLTGSGANWLYTPTRNFVGNDSFQFTATDNDGLVSAPATVAINVKGMNTAPVAVMDYTATGLDVVFVGSDSSDADGDALTYQWDFGDGITGSGIEVSHRYASAGSYTASLTVSDSTSSDIATATLTVSATTPPGGRCEHVIQNSWDTGFVAAIRIHNTGTRAIEGWQLTWLYPAGITVTDSWNALLTGSNPYTATALDWNGRIEPGQSVELGMQGTRPAGLVIPTIVVSGDVCQ